MKLFGIGGKLKDKLSAVRFEYTLTIHNLSPWPDSGNRAVAIGWQRGKKKRGATRSVYPSSQPGKLGNVARFNEKFELSATLYKVRVYVAALDVARCWLQVGAADGVHPP
jgi:hypothetical protein